MDHFDVSDRNSWYFGNMSRQMATEILMNEQERGVFLVRDSNSIVGDYVLCVREDAKVSNYIINKIQKLDQTYFRIGDQEFENLPKLLTFYTLHYLDTTPLKRPAQKRLEKVIAKFDFDGSDSDDLPFRRGEVLIVIRKDEEQWWTAKNALGQIGQIPVPYIQRFDENAFDAAGALEQLTNNSSAAIACALSNKRTGGGNSFNCTEANHHQQQHIQHCAVGGAGDNSLKKSDLNRKLPAFARVKQARVPNAYDKTALKLEVGDIIKVTKTNINGQWEGELHGKKGHFPFTHVEFLQEANADDADDQDAVEFATTNANANALHAQTANTKDWGE